MSMIFRNTAILFLALVMLEACDTPRSENSKINTSGARCPLTTNGTISLDGGEFLMGSEDFYPDEGPIRRKSIDRFQIDIHEVTNRQFAAFVDATGYVTKAEQKPDPSLHPDIPAQMLVPGSAVFVQLDKTGGGAWQFVAGAHWRAPEGPGTSIEDRMDHPVRPYIV